MPPGRRVHAARASRDASRLRGPAAVGTARKNPAAVDDDPLGLTWRLAPAGGGRLGAGPRAGAALRRGPAASAVGPRRLGHGGGAAELLLYARQMKEGTARELELTQRCPAEAEQVVGAGRRGAPRTRPLGPAGRKCPSAAQAHRPRKAARRGGGP